MLNYAAAAQVNFDYKTEELANAIDADTVKALFPNYTTDKVNTVVAAMTTYGTAYDVSMLDAVVAADSTIVGDWTRDKANCPTVVPSLALEGIITNNYKVKFTNAIMGNVKEAKMLFWTAEKYEELLAAGEVFSVENASYVQEFTDEDKDTSGRYEGKYDKTAAKDLGKTLYLCAYVETNDGSVYVSGVISHSADAYLLDRVTNSTDAKMIAVAKALAVYGECANAQFN